MNVIQPWSLFRSGTGTAASNMAWDEALLEAAPQLGQPVLRFYGWSEAAASFGYFQKYANVASMTALRPLVRRPTGGGLVPHQADWTYSLAFPPVHPWYSLSAIESYQRIHRWIQASLARCGVQTELSSASQKEAPGRCFAGAEKFDVLWNNRKMAGAAQRRTRNGLLIQGSVQPIPPSIPRDTWENAFEEVGRLTEHIFWISFDPDAELKQRAQILEETKYAQAAYNAKR
jgi:lipoate-protein ligase A